MMVQAMDPSVVDRIFEPFYTHQACQSRDRARFSIVHGIVRAHDGQIFVDTIPDQGTVFTIYLRLLEYLPRIR